jgi:hypothetical protein
MAPLRTTSGKRALLNRKLRQARIHYESAMELQAVADGLFAEARRLVDEIADLQDGRPAPLYLTVRTYSDRLN